MEETNDLFFIFFLFRTTLHLTYIIDHKMVNEPSFRETGFEEIINIFST
jgi:hypothetical protein